jgi:hypothetical protein
MGVDLIVKLINEIGRQDAGMVLNLRNSICRFPNVRSVKNHHHFARVILGHDLRFRYRTKTFANSGQHGRPGLDNKAADTQTIHRDILTGFNSGCSEAQVACKRMASTGHPAKQAPHPVQPVASMDTAVRPRNIGRALMTSSSQVSRQRTQGVPCSARHLSVTSAVTCQGRFFGCPALLTVLSSAPVWHTASQSPQNVQEPSEKSITGRLAALSRTMFCPQADLQSPQPLHFSENAATSAQGGRISALLSCRLPRRNRARVMDLIQGTSLQSRVEFNEYHIGDELL